LDQDSKGNCRYEQSHLLKQHYLEQIDVAVQQQHPDEREMVESIDDIPRSKGLLSIRFKKGIPDCVGGVWGFFFGAKKNSVTFNCALGC
jgi:hypothetical protein